MPDLFALQNVVKSKDVIKTIPDYYNLCLSFLELLHEIKPTKIISPTDSNYIFYQFDEQFNHKITRPLNGDLFSVKPETFKRNFDSFFSLLEDMKKSGMKGAEKSKYKKFHNNKGINSVIYTIQQCIGSIGDSFTNPNQTRKRIGQLFEQLIQLILLEIGFECESRTIKIPLPNNPKHSMSYELDLVFSKGKAIITSEYPFVGKNEVIGSVKTTSKDRVDKIFLDKYMITKMLGREISVIAIFLHDVQRAQKQGSIFGINSTFKAGHFVGYTLSLNRLDGVYYIDPRPNMISDSILSREISDFSRFLLLDIWNITRKT